jgi:hypothetical protein
MPAPLAFCLRFACSAPCHPGPCPSRICDNEPRRATRNPKPIPLLRHLQSQIFHTTHLVAVALALLQGLIPSLCGPFCGINCLSWHIAFSITLPSRRDALQEVPSVRV